MRRSGPLALLGALFLSISSAAGPALAQDPPPDAPVAPDEPPPPEPPRKPPPPAVVPDAPIADGPVDRPVDHKEDPPKPEERPNADGDARSLKGHAFLAPALLDTAFVVTSASLAFMIGSRQVPGVQVTSTNNTGVGHVFSYDRSAGVTQGDAALSVALGRYIDLDLAVSYQSLLPSNAEGVLLFGGSSSYDVRPGLRARVFRSPATGTQIGLHGYGVFAGGSRLNPAGVLAQVAAQIPALAIDPTRVACLSAGDLACALGNKSSLEAMKVSRQQYAGGVSASVAQAFVSRFGAQATVGFELGRSKVTSKASGALGATPLAVYVGVAPSLDLMPSAPIGAMIEYRFRYANESSSGGGTSDASTTHTLEHGLAAGLYYTGRRDLQAGVRFRGAFSSSSVTFSGSSADQPGTTDLGGELALRYFF